MMYCVHEHEVYTKNYYGNTRVYAHNVDDVPNINN